MDGGETACFQWLQLTFLLLYSIPFKEASEAPFQKAQGQSMRQMIAS